MTPFIWKSLQDFKYFDAIDCVSERVDGLLLHEDAFHTTSLAAKYVQRFDNQ